MLFKLFLINYLAMWHIFQPCSGHGVPKYQLVHIPLQIIYTKNQYTDFNLVNITYLELIHRATIKEDHLSDG